MCVCVFLEGGWAFCGFADIIENRICYLLGHCWPHKDSILAFARLAFMPD